MTSDLDVAPGRIVYTLLANERGGIEMDPTITRLAEDRFLVLAPTADATPDRRRCSGAGCPASAVVTDVTSGLATLHLAGPRSRELLARLTDADVSAAAWPFLQAREIEVGRACARGRSASRSPASSAGSCRCPTEFVADLYEHVVRAGADLGLRHAGAFAFEAARLERGFRSWGHDIGPRYDPFAAGLGFAVSRRKAADFVGREALERLRAAEPEQRLVCVHAPDAVLWHGESVLRDGERVGLRDERLDRADPRRLGRPGLGPRPARGRRGGSRSAATRSRAGSASSRSTTRAASACAAERSAVAGVRALGPVDAGLARSSVGWPPMCPKWPPSTVGMRPRRPSRTTRRPTSATRSAVNPNCSKIVPGRRRRAEVVEPDDRALVADPALPAERHADLDADALADRRRQHRVAVRLVLRVERLPAGERHDAGADAVRLEPLRPPRTPAAAPNRSR